MSERNVIRTRDLAEALGIEIELATSKIVMDLFSGAVQKTPVDTGRARASWRAQEGEIDESVAPETEARQPPPQLPRLRISGEDIVFVSNSLPYAEPLENGHSRQAPQGMLGLTIAEVEADVEQYLPRDLK